MRRLVVLVGAALVVGVAVLTSGAVTADAGKCALWDGTDLNVGVGECYYVARGDRVHESGVVVAGGTLNGGDGIDVVATMSGGAFNGGGGIDAVTTMSGGTFNGGDATDLVGSLYDGTFNGGSGADNVADMYGGTFNGGGGDDSIATGNTGMLGGTFNGGPGNDDAGAVVCANVGVSIFIWSATYTCT